MSTKKSIIQNTRQISGATLLSRFFGIAREFLMVRYLGADAFSDAFLNVFKIPNSLRKIFAEGALSAAFIPTIVQTVRSDGKKTVSSLMSLSFLIFEGVLLIICALVMWQAAWVIRIISGGFSHEQVIAAVPWLRLLMPFILFVSSSALLAGALQSVGHFFVPAFSPVLLNIVFIIGLLICLAFKLPINALCCFILFGAFLQFMWHVVVYLKLHFTFSAVTYENLKKFKGILWKFLLCLPSTSVEELNLFIDTSFASYLSKGSISLIYYANRFMGIPLGVFGVAFATVLLPHFSRVSMYAPKRLGYYLLESAKIIIWVMLPVALLMGFFADKFFITIFLSKKFSLAQAHEAALILQIFLVGLVFFAVNKILRNIFYAFHEMSISAYISVCSLIINTLINWLLLEWLQAAGLTIATVISAMVQTLLYVAILRKKFNLPLYGKALCIFVSRYCLQIVVLGVPFLVLYKGLEWVIMTQCTAYAVHLLLNTIGFWFWVSPLSALFILALFYFRRQFNVSLYFLD